MTGQYDELEERWGELNTPVFTVLDEDGENMADAQVREDPHGGWLYVDNVDGYDVLSADDVHRLTLEPRGTPRGPLPQTAGRTQEPLRAIDQDVFIELDEDSLPVGVWAPNVEEPVATDEAIATAVTVEFGGAWRLGEWGNAEGEWDFASLTRLTP